MKKSKEITFYLQIEQLLSERKKLFSELSKEKEITLLSNLSNPTISALTIGYISQKINTYEPSFLPKLSLFDHKDYRPTIKSISQTSSPIQSCYSIIDPPTSCESSPLITKLDDSIFNSENKRIPTFNEICSLIIDSNLLILSTPEPKRVYHNQFQEGKKFNSNENEPRELLLENIDATLSRICRDESQLDNYFMKFFYEISNLNNHDYRFYVSRIRFLFYKGKYSVLIKFCDSISTNFLYFSLFHKKG